MAEAVHKRLQSELEKFNTVQREYQKLVRTRQQLDSQLNENNLVIEELKLLEPDAGVYKMIGPVLVKQNLTEAKQNVEKRIQYINGEIKRHDTTIKELEKKQVEYRETLTKLQHQLQTQQQKTAKA